MVLLNIPAILLDTSIVTFLIVLLLLALTLSLIYLAYHTYSSPFKYIWYMPMAGVKCKNCASQGLEVWVIPGKHCHVCGTAC